MIVMCMIIVDYQLWVVIRLDFWLIGALAVHMTNDQSCVSFIATDPGECV